MKPLILIVLDGWGYKDPSPYNAIANAHKPVWDKLWQTCPHMLLQGSGSCVGLPEGQMGNSEVGHMNLGLGRVVHQDFTRISNAIASQTFQQNTILNAACAKAKALNSRLHILGLLSPGGVHSHEAHILAMIELALSHNVNEIYLHAILDGRDTPPKSALASILQMQTLANQHPQFKIASLIGRYYAMDRDNRWDRIEIAYRLYTEGVATYHAQTAQQALSLAYADDRTDEFVPACSIHPPLQSPITIKDNDVVIMMNFRADRAREITQAFINPAFTGFSRDKIPKLADYVSLTQYDKMFNCQVAFPASTLKNGLGEYLSAQGYTQLRIAETEKYAHVTFFFNGGIEAPYPNEFRELIPSPKVATYDLQPQMSANEITDRLVSAITGQTYDVIICNFANPDMVGHTGNYAATVQAIETIDHCLGRIIDALATVHGELLITADHGNAEQMFDPATGQAHTAHTSDPVPLIYYGRAAHFITTQGVLADIAPTMLYLLGEPVPPEMTGKILLALK